MRLDIRYLRLIDVFSSQEEGRCFLEVYCRRKTEQGPRQSGTGSKY